jgi:ribosomal protein S18 acetylase RimI-like enzyme
MADIESAVREAGTVRKVTATEVPGVSSALAQAFYDDPPTMWVIPDDSRRMRVLERFFSLCLRKLWLAQDECYTTGGIVGGAVWELPGKWQVSVAKQLRLLPAMAVAYGRFLPRVMRAIAALESNHPEEPHHYLAFAGVTPEWQGRGIGAALMRPVLERCDREQVPAYLEASTPRNRALYERHGFEVTEEFTLGRGSPPLWRMWRKPVS